MLEVDIEKIIPVTDARDSLNQIIETVEGSDSMYVITKNGKPSAIIVGVHHLEKLTGMKSDELSVDEEPTASVPKADEKAEAAATTTEEEPYKPAAVAQAPFTLEPEEDDIFAPLPEPEEPATPVPTPAPATEPLVDLSKASAPISATPVTPAAPATPPAQAPADQL